MSLTLCMIFRNGSLDEGGVPLDWRAVDVVPLYKKVQRASQIITVRLLLV